MPHFSYSEVLTEAAGVKIVTSLFEEDSLASGRIILRIQKLDGSSDKSCGFHLTKSKWDPYPWIGYVEDNSPADLAGLRAGDCLLSIGDVDLLGLKIKDIATLIRGERDTRDMNFSVWRYPYHEKEQNDIGLALKGPLPDVARNLANVLSETVRTLECPICLESAAPPVSQCVHGHILCVMCRPKTTRCPVCRIRLGQGRCLLADNLHRIFRDTFNTSNNETVIGRADAPDRRNLRDQLFGRNSKRQETSVVRKNNALKPRQFLLTRLLLGDREKAASADNLTRVSGSVEDAATVSDRATTVDSLHVRLSLSDRTKSASTGELSKGSDAHIDSSLSRIAELSREISTANGSQHSLSSLRTPIWGGSVDSVSCVHLACPLLHSCREVATSDSLLEHIKIHAIPQVHFYSASAKIPVPLPFGRDAFYIFHHGGDMFFLQFGEETAWMTYLARLPCASNVWEWTLHAWGENGTTIQLRRHVASLEEPVTLSSQHVVPLSNALSLKIINVHISQLQPHDRSYV